MIPTPVNMKTIKNIYLYMYIYTYTSITEKFTLLKHVLLANFALFVYVSTDYAEPVKLLEFIRYVQLTRWSRGHASDWGARGPGFGSRLWKWFFCLCFVVASFTFFVKKIFLSWMNAKFSLFFFRSLRSRFILSLILIKISKQKHAKNGFE